MNDKELEERIKEIKNTNSTIPICVVYDVKITDDSYLLKVVFNKKRKGNNEERIIKLKKSYLSKGNKLNGKSLTGKLYLLFKIDKYSANEDERNIKLFLVLKKIGVVTKDNKIDIDKFKGLVFQVKGNHTNEIKRNPNYVFRYDYLFNCKSTSMSTYNTKKLFDGYEGYEKDHREFRKVDRKNVKMLKDSIFENSKEKVDDLITEFKDIIKEKYNENATYDKVCTLFQKILDTSTHSKPKIKKLSAEELSKVISKVLKRLSNLENKVSNLESKVSNLENKVHHLESCIEDRDVTIREYKERLEEQDRKIRKQNRRIDELEKKLNR
jgi:hypothetical protein